MTQISDDVTSFQKKIVEKTKNLTFPKGAVIHSMTTKVPVIQKGSTVEQTRQVFLENAKHYNTVNYAYIVNKHNKLQGAISIRELLAARPDALVEETMINNLVKAHPRTDKEKAAHLAVKHNIKAVPVVDKYNNFLGVVPNDTILTILDQESEEDLLRLSGIVLGEEHKTEESDLPVRISFIHRIPWIIFGLFGGLFTAKVIGGFEGVLQEHIILASFIPLVAYIANAVGVQTQTLFIRDLSTNRKIMLSSYTLKQIATSLLIGIACWITIIAISAVVWNWVYLGFIVGLAVICAILVATIFALIIPYFLQKMKQDPAIGSGPFTTIIQDLLSIIIYFLIASILL
jgi:magnesium transporter